MTIKEFLRELYNKLKNKSRYKDREMKRVFQWRRFIEWKDLTHEEKLGVKRFILLPIVAYFVISFINQYFLSIVFLICLYFAYKKLQKGNLMK